MTENLPFDIFLNLILEGKISAISGSNAMNLLILFMLIPFFFFPTDNNNRENIYCEYEGEISRF